MTTPSEPLRQHLYARVLKTKTSYFTQVDGKYTPLGSDRAEAERKLDVILGMDHADTIESMCRSYLAEQRKLLAAGDRGALSERTISDYTTSLNVYVLPVFGKERPSNFKPKDAAKFLDNARKAGRTVRGNRDMAALASAFNHGMVLGLVDENPCRGVRRNREHARKRLVQVAELNAFLAHAMGKGGSAYLVALIACLTALSGRRRAEILALPLSAITSDGIRCRSAKVKAGETAREYLIEWSPMTRQLVTEVKGVKRRVGSLFLFATNDGQPYKDSGFCTLWQKLMKGYVDAGGARFNPHDLRAMYVSLTLDKGLNPNTHQNEETMRRVYDRRAEIKVTPLA
jgi:integrase